MLKCLRTTGAHNLIEDYCTIIGSTEFSLLGLVEDHAACHTFSFSKVYDLYDRYYLPPSSHQISIL